ncbi:MAG: SGNH/GDSL hydrolase family protein [Candidatus Omnitrophica bacterium]|nr:SGNH/GDSL hydrolase family protein [Candidatus Omnitrophota bacterium]
MMTLLIALGVQILGSPPQAGGIPIRTVADWSVEVGPGTVTLDGREITLARGETLVVEPPERRSIRDEAHPALPLFRPKAGGWLKGSRLEKLITVECTATGLLLPETVRVKAQASEGPVLSRGSDYEMDEFWGTIGRLEGGKIGEGIPVRIDYDYTPCRLDSVVVGPEGKVSLVRGTPGVGSIEPPRLAPGETAIANLWIPGPIPKLTAENLFPIERVESPPVAPVAERLLPKTLEKLRAGNEVTIVAWGDSVTDGGGVEKNPELRYQNQFAKALQERFPKAAIRMLTAGWGGQHSRGYMEAPPEGAKVFARDVLEPKPDLVTIEFVNDAYLSEEQTQEHYRKIKDILEANGSEIILITPHLVRPDWMAVTTMKFDEDPRPYVKGLYRFAKENGVALADGSRRWCELWRQGIPYVTLEANSINHPDARGHALFAEALMELFPE